MATGEDHGLLEVRAAAGTTRAGGKRVNVILTDGGTLDGKGGFTLPSSGVPSVAGTANQVLVNGGTAAATGAVTLTLPQNIHTGATPQFAGISFGGSTLSTYAEGTFTPVLRFGGASTGITYTAQIGLYSRIGKIVVVKIRLLLSSKGTATGAATIGTLPVSGNTTAGFYDVMKSGSGTGTFTGQLYAYIDPSAPTVISLGVENNGVDGGVLTDANFNNTSAFNITLVYLTN